MLVLEGVDHVKKQGFHRAIGGGIEFGESAEAALRREFREELNVGLSTVDLLGVLENIFEYQGMPGHEVVHVFAVSSPELDAIPLDAQLTVLDEGSPVRWVRTSDMERPLYPSGIEAILRNLARR